MYLFISKICLLIIKVLPVLCKIFQAARLRSFDHPTAQLVQRFLLPHILSTYYFRHRRVVVSQQCHRIASFLRLALTKIVSTKYMGIKETLY